MLGALVLSNAIQYNSSDINSSCDFVFLINVAPGGVVYCTALY